MQKRSKFLQVFLAQPLRIDQQLVAGDFQVAELRPLLERELDLLRREDVEQQHLVPAMAEVLQRAQQRRDLSKQSDRITTRPRR